MDELVAELAASSKQTCERVIDEFSGAIKSGTGSGDSRETRPLHEKASSFIEELRRSWGPTADPSLANEVVPGRGKEPLLGLEEDCLFALFRRPGILGYIRLRALREEKPEAVYLKLVLGVARNPKTP
jgi:hypothetical protein